MFIIFPRCIQYLKIEGSFQIFPKSDKQHSGMKDGVEILFCVFNLQDIHGKEKFSYFVTALRSLRNDKDLSCS